MTTLHLKRRWAEADNQKVTCLAALAFFLVLSAAAPSQATTNTAKGTAFGTDYALLSTAPSIASVSNGPGTLAIGFAGTTNLNLSHRISGSITISNRFDAFTLIGGSSVVSNTQTAALYVSGGTNLTIRGGAYRGVRGGGGIVLPPTPGLPAQTNTTSSAGSGAVFSGTKNIRISQASFSGATYNPDASHSLGTRGVGAYNTTLTFTDDGANSSTLTGGRAGSVSFLGGSATALGGAGLFASGSSLTVSNGTFRGGSGGSALSGFNAQSFGGDALYATNSTVNIFKGAFTGGAAGSAASTTGGAIAMGGAALWADASDLSIHGGTFTGGNTEGNPAAAGGAALLVDDSTVLIDGTPVFTGGTGAPALQSYNSDLFIDGGTFTGGALGSGQQFGLISTVDAGALNTVILNSGTFNSIAFKGSGNQFFNTGTNLVVQDYIVQDAGTVTVEHESDAPFQEVYIRGGSIHFKNALTLSGGGWFELGSAGSRATIPGLELQPGSTLNLGLGKFMTPGHVGVQENATLLVSIGQQNSGGLFTDTIVFGNQSILFADAGSANFGVGTNTVSVIDATTGISVVDSGGTTNTATDANFANNVDLKSSESGRTKLSGATIDSGRFLRLQFNTESLKDYWNASGQMALLANELDGINNPVMMSIIDDINNPYISKAAVEQTYFTTMNTFQTSLLGLQAALGQTTARGIEFREQLKLEPDGAKGPDFEPANSLRAWGKYYGHFINRDKEGLNSSYDTILHGGVIGVDQSFGNLLLGVSGGAGFYSTSTDTDADEDINAYSAALYSTYYFPRAYIDAGVAYGFNDVSTKTAEPFRLDGDFDANLISAYFGGGYDLIDTKGGTVFTPEASLQYTYYEQDSYTETGVSAVPRRVDEYDASSLRTSLGINTSMLNTEALEEFGFKIDGRVHWIHEFNADPDDMTFGLAGGAADYQLTPPSLEEDLFRIGIGCAFFNTRQNKPKNVMLRLDFDELFGDGFNAHNVSAKLVYAF